MQGGVQAHPALEVSRAFLDRHSPAPSLADLTDISTDSRHFPLR